MFRHTLLGGQVHSTFQRRMHFYMYNNATIHLIVLLKLKCNLPLTRGPSAIAESLVILVVTRANHWLFAVEIEQETSERKNWKHLWKTTMKFHWRIWLHAVKPFMHVLDYWREILLSVRPSTCICIICVSAPCLSQVYKCFFYIFSFLSRFCHFSRFLFCQRFYF